MPPESTPAPGTAALVRVNLVAAVAFTLGGSLFALGALFAERGVGSTTTVNVTYLVGGFFFSLGGYTSIVLALNLVTLRRAGSDAPRLSWWGLLPRDLGWRSAMVLFVGTLFFAVSLVAAFASGLTPRQSDGWIWLPDIIGCVCFLASGQLALLDVGEGHVDVRLHDLGWWIAAINQFGSVLFFLAGLAAFVRPATSEVVNVGLVNWGTFSGAACFAVAGFAQIFDRPSLGERVVESRA